MSGIPSFVQKCAYSLEPFRLPPSVFDRAIPIEEEARYRLVSDLISHRQSLEDTIWFEQLRVELKTRGMATHKSMTFRDEGEILDFLRVYALGLVESMESSGYDETRTADVATAFIDRTGTICKCDAGNHRFSVARLVGAKEVPVEILGVHHDWYRTTIGNGGYETLRGELRKVEAGHKGRNLSS